MHINYELSSYIVRFYEYNHIYNSKVLHNMEFTSNLF